jgi:hypothetical protein
VHELRKFGKYPPCLLRYEPKEGKPTLPHVPQSLRGKLKCLLISVVKSLFMPCIVYRMDTEADTIKTSALLAVSASEYR